MRQCADCGLADEQIMFTEPWKVPCPGPKTAAGPETKTVTDTEILALLREVRGETRPCPHEGEEDDDCDCPDAVRVSQLDAAIAGLESRTAQRAAPRSP